MMRYVQMATILDFCGRGLLYAEITSEMFFYVKISGERGTWHNG